jgi:hypothetical protein
MNEKPAKYRSCFRSYGVGVSVESNSAEVLEQASAAARSALLHQVEEIDCGLADHTFELWLEPDGTCTTLQDGESMVSDKISPIYWKYFDSLVRLLVADFTTSRVFVHAGVVGWRGKAIVMPGDSYFGKTTFVAELVKCGAEYYSDEYAVIDPDGLVHPFARKLTMRTDGRHIIESAADVEDFGGRKGIDPIPVSCVFFTKYVPESDPDYQFMSTGQGIVEIVGQTIAIRRNAEFAIKVLKNAFSNAIIVKSPRTDATQFARDFLEFVDNTAF